MSYMLEFNKLKFIFLIGYKSDKLKMTFVRIKLKLQFLQFKQSKTAKFIYIHDLKKNFLYN